MYLTYLPSFTLGISTIKIGVSLCGTCLCTMEIDFKKFLGMKAANMGYSGVAPCGDLFHIQKAPEIIWTLKSRRLIRPLPLCSCVSE